MILLLVGNCINYIEENINNKTSEIIKGLENKCDLSRTPIDNKFKKICRYEDGTSDTTSSYIKGRKIQLGIQEGDRLKEARVKFDIKSTLRLAEKMNCIQKYGFGTVEINPENYKKYTYDLDYNKILDFTFKDSLLIYPNLAEGYTPKEVLEYNKCTIDLCDFDNFYGEEVYLVNEVLYFKTNRNWLINIAMGDIKSKLTLGLYMYDYLYDDLSKYKTMIQKTKANLGEHIYIEATKSVKPSNEDSMQIIFNTILDIERGKLINPSLKDIYEKYKDKGIYKSYEYCKSILGGLLLSGKIYIK